MRQVFPSGRLVIKQVTDIIGLFCFGMSARKRYLCADLSHQYLGLDRFRTHFFCRAGIDILTLHQMRMQTHRDFDPQQSPPYILSDSLTAYVAGNYLRADLW
jgi:hypothetical protein